MWSISSTRESDSNMQIWREHSGRKERRTILVPAEQQQKRKGTANFRSAQKIVWRMAMAAIAGPGIVARNLC